MAECIILLDENKMSSTNNILICMVTYSTMVYKKNLYWSIEDDNHRETLCGRARGFNISDL